jgi:hypothetical protein
MRSGDLGVIGFTSAEDQRLSAYCTYSRGNFVCPEFPEISSALTANGIPPKAVLATLPKARERIFERRYGPHATEGTASQRRGSRSRAK